MGVITVFLCFVTLIFTFLHCITLYNKRHSNFPPGPPRLPIYGGYWYLLKENYFFTYKGFIKLIRKYNADVLGLYLGSTPTVVPATHQLVKESLTKEDFNGRNDTFVSKTRSLGETLGIFFTDGPFWYEQRRFTLRYLRDFGFGRRFQESESFIESEIRELIEFLTTKPSEKDSDVCREKGKVLLPDIFHGPVMNIVLHFLVGQKFENRELREVGNSILKFLQITDATGYALVLTPWLRYISPKFFGYTDLKKETQISYDFIEKIINQRKRNLSEGHSSDFLDVYLSHFNSVQDLENSSCTEKQMVWVLIDILLPASSALSPVLQYMFAYLIIYPHLQKKIREEIHSVVGKSRLPNLNDRQNMHYTEAFIREVLRKEPLLPISTPRRSIRDTTLGRYKVPKDSFVLPCQWTANHDPTVWDDPHTFKPERFLDKNGSLIKTDKSMPFGGGKRVCVGETFSRHVLFLFLTGLLQNFLFKEVDKLPDIEKKTPGFVVLMENYWAEAILD